MISKSSLRTAASVAVGALCGLALGVLFCEWVVERQAEVDAGRFADAYTARADEIAAEVGAAFEELNRSPDPGCSDADLAHLRRVVMSSHFLKSAARQGQGRTLCSSDLGRIDEPRPLPPATFVTDRGVRVSIDASTPSSGSVLMARDGAAVAVSVQAYLAQLDSRFEFTVIARHGGESTPLVSTGSALPPDKAQLVPGARVEMGQRRYEVRCTTNRNTCVLATAMPPSPPYQSPVFMGFALCGLLAGAGCGFGAGSVIGRSRPLGKSLRAAVRAGTLTVAYQPIVRLSDRQPAGAEALLRWNDTAGNPISPNVFIVVAEEEGFILELTQFVVKRVLAELGEELRRRPGFRVTINVSAHDLLNPGFASFLKDQLQAANVSVDSIGFELTERSTAERSAIGRGIQRLRDIGHKVYIDDFGTDYSSLSYLAHLHVDAIKIDRSFTLALRETGQGASIAPQIVAMAEALGLILVIEGIEDESQAAYFLKLDPSALAQGWLFGKPVPASGLFAEADPEGERAAREAEAIRASLNAVTRA